MKLTPHSGRTHLPTGWWVRSRQVEIPRWGATIEVRSLSWAERLNYVSLAFGSDRDWPDWTAIAPLVLISCCYSPETGEKVFHPTDEDQIRNLHPEPVKQLVDAALEVSGISGVEDSEAAHLRFITDGDFYFLFDLAFEWHIPASELAARMPSWEVGFWASYLVLRKTRMNQPKGNSTTAPDAQGFGGPSS